MIVEVGTSDFRTQAGKEDGLFIEPVKYYFDRLPGCNKVNVAISNYEGYNHVYFLSEKAIERYNLPKWVRGCNSIGDIHPTVDRLMTEKGIGSCCIEVVEVKRLHTVIAEAGITEYDHLKIDTEGHDCVILNDYLDNTTFYPKKITFESNALSDKTEVAKLVDRLSAIGYSCKQVTFDIVCELS